MPAGSKRFWAWGWPYCTFSQVDKENLHAVFCLAESAVGPNAARPDDIHVLYSGL